MKAPALMTVLFCLLVAALAPAAAPEDWQSDPQHLTFTANDLYGHINGGAELFLEFGFIDLTVTHWQQDDAGMDVEVYRMSDTDAALGIYLARSGRETPVEGVCARNSGNAYQIVAVRGTIYLQINSFSGNAELIPTMAALANDALSGICEADSPAIFDLLPADGLVSSSPKLVRGPFGLEPVYTFGPGDILSLDSKVLAAVGRYRIDQDDHIRIVVAYPDAEQAAKAMVHLRGNLDSLLKVVRDGDTGFTFSDWRGDFGRVLCEENHLRIVVGLETEAKALKYVPLRINPRSDPDDEVHR